MKSNSKKRSGFGLIEMIISMAVISILSVGVYNAYMILIKQTKQGQVKQTSTLLGNEISEQIKAVTENAVFSLGSTGVDFTKEIHLIKDGKNANKYKGEVHFKEDGSLALESEEYRYRAFVELEHKTTTKDKVVSIEEVVTGQSTPADVQNLNISIVKPKDSSSQIIDTNVSGKIDSDKVDGDKTVEINISEDYKITIESSELGKLNYTFNKDKKQEITLDCKYCTGAIKIETTNTTRVPLDLFILNGNNVTVDNIKGILHEYRRSEVGDKIGELYNVKLDIYDEKSDAGFRYIDNRPIFQTSFVQNVNIK